MTTRKRTTIIAVLTVVALVAIAGVAWAAGVFPDVDPNDPHYDAINWAAENGIVKGYTNGNFGPYDPILRGQAATMFQNYDTFLRDDGELTSACKVCHDASDLISSKQAQWSLSLHGEGEVFAEDGGEASCAGCHSGGGFSDMVAAGKQPNQLTAGDPSPSRQDCRACHQVHETYTTADWSLETTAAVPLYALSGNTFNGGTGNLCAVCHQPRRAFPAPVDGNIAVTERFGPHHGPQSAMLLGIGGALAPAGGPMFHNSIPNTCVACHMGSNGMHTFAPNVATCEPCHAGAEDFNIGETQTEVQALLDQLKTGLIAAGLLTEDNGVVSIVAGTYPEAQAGALWNWIYVNNEDKSLGVHNPTYTKAILNAGIAALAG
jgi:hypothetical protein